MFWHGDYAHLYFTPTTGGEDKYTIMGIVSGSLNENCGESGGGLPDYYTYVANNAHCFKRPNRKIQTFIRWGRPSNQLLKGWGHPDEPW